MATKGKFLVMACVVALSCIFVISNVTFAANLVNKDRQEPGAQNSAAQARTEDDIAKPDPSRGADIGFVTEAEHNSIRRFIGLSVQSGEVTTQQEIAGEFGEKIVVQTIKGFRNADEDRRAAGHFSIRGQMADGKNVVYVTVDEDEYNKNPKLAQHEVEEYKATAKEAVKKAGLEEQKISQGQLLQAKQNLVDWLDDPSVSTADKNTLLLGIHNSVPTQLGATERDIMPDTLAYLQSLKGLRGASGLGEQASKEQIVVIGAKEVLADKGAFNRWLIKEGAKLSVSIIATNKDEYDQVKDYERIWESSIRVKIATAVASDWMQGLDPNQIITIKDKDVLKQLIEDLRANAKGIRLDRINNLNPALVQAIAVGV